MVHKFLIFIGFLLILLASTELLLKIDQFPPSANFQIISEYRADSGNWMSSNECCLLKNECYPISGHLFHSHFLRFPCPSANIVHLWQRLLRNCALNCEREKCQLSEKYQFLCNWLPGIGKKDQRSLWPSSWSVRMEMIEFFKRTKAPIKQKNPTIELSLSGLSLTRACVDSFDLPPVNSCMWKCGMIPWRVNANFF